ncbi:TerB family tellurite resistance protein [Spirochaeta cellobiosiphila]|uniref:TerB family tellurite resistance protein n=1 Tax=Spirochaeta cellobiosiphila TaxID=504483 RepID=UPI0004018356|nr:TerB family tellurite resistance protein [Spirochaeta cellobiosiphila]
MADVQTLNDKEKQFLAGSIKSMVLADGQIDDEEIQEITKITNELNFSDFDQSLEQFEIIVKDQETFWDLSKTITDTSKQDIILDILYDLSLQEGYSHLSQNKLINKIKQIWGRD